MASILVIDDEPTLRKALNRLLTLTGHQVSEAENGRLGLKSYQAAPADIVLLDMYMPEMDGLETLESLLRHDPKAKVIAMTGGGVFQNIDVLWPAVLMGALKILHKPIDLTRLQSVIAEALAKTV